jgi:hypothetical protein
MVSVCFTNYLVLYLLGDFFRLRRSHAERVWSSLPLESFFHAAASGSTTMTRALRLTHTRISRTDRADWLGVIEGHVAVIVEHSHGGF